MAHNGTNPHAEGNLTAAQARALAALLKERDVRAAAKAAKVGERTFWSWMKLPAFKSQLDDAMSEMIDSAIFDLARLTRVAVGTLYTVMTDGNAPPGSRVQAANVVLARLIDLRDFKDFDERLTEIEKALQIKGR